MARNYKRDSRGRFARAVGKSQAKKNAAQQYRIDRATNRSMAKKAVQLGIVNKKNARILKRNANAKAKVKYKRVKASIREQYR